MKIDSITQSQLDLLRDIVTQTPLFSVAIIPEGHKNYEAKAKIYQKVADDVKALEALGFVKDVTDKEGVHRKIIERIEKESGYKYFIYVVNEAGVLMHEAHATEVEKENKFKHGIN